MIDFGGFVTQGGMPIYIQILLFIKRGIAAGVVQDGDELPSRRVLSALLGINPNTAQKIYRILEEEGLLASRSGAKSVMTLDEKKMTKIRAELMENDGKVLVQSMRQMGLSKAEAIALIETYWE